MIVFKVFPTWAPEKAEAFLNRMAEKGFRLTAVKLSCFYVFEKEKHENVKYKVTYVRARDCDPKICEFKNMLLTQYHAKKIITSVFTGFEYFRLCNCDDSFEDLDAYRTQYYIETCRKRIACLIAYCCILGVPAALAIYFQNSCFLLWLLVFPALVILHYLAILLGLKKNQKG